MSFDKIVNRRGTYCTQWDYVKDRFGESDLLPFTISDTDFEVPEIIKLKLMERVEHGVFGYTRWQHSDFENSVSKWFLERFGHQLVEKSLVYSPSVMFSIALLIQLVSDEGDKIVIQTPAYDAFYEVIKSNNRELVENPLHYQSGTYTIDWTDLEIKLSHPDTKILLFCSPHNPTGRVWTNEELEKLVNLCQKYRVFLISDEIHMDIVARGFHHRPLLEYASKDVALVTSGSKTFNFPGLIFSYGIIPDPMLRERFLHALKKTYGLSSASTMGLVATMTAYNQCSDWVDQLNDYIDENRRYVKEFLTSHLPAVKVVKSEATYLMWLDIRCLPFDPAEIQRRLVKIGKLAIMSGKMYGADGQYFLRLNIGCPRSKLEEALSRMLQALS
ncbi:TPA: MalY/PatB family protein [Streptococcus suis]